ncbi:protein KHNYN-like [Hyperolius riggenbachi]|uniref:protein KHNYN-like n=1 Tax=Hyperolius riggenbachi TaxID=752182 RepID=UPI0035A3951C
MLMAVGEYEAIQDDESVDEFAVPQGSEKELRSQQSQIERLFGVNVNIIGVLTEDQLSLQSTGHQQIWVQLYGERRSIVQAKDYIKGLCTPELMEDFTYPREMHCIFVGAEGLFLDCLIRATSACIRPQTHGLLRISGLAEGVVMAHSRIQAFLDDYEGKPEELITTIKRNFKALVEEHNDHHALDLLILPNSTKEQLLSLVEEDKDIRSKRPINQETSKQPLDKSICQHPMHSTPVDYQSQRLDRVSQPVEITRPRPVRRILRERASEPREVVRNNKWHGNNQQVPLSRQERPLVEFSEDDSASYIHERHKPHERVETLEKDDDEFQQISGLLDTIMRGEDGESSSHPCFSMGTQKEFNMLLDFFKTMGYQESIVLKVLSENGIQEPSQILDKVKLEQSGHDQKRSRPVLKHFSLKEASAATCGNDTKDSDDDDDYLLEVMKSAAINCGYSPSEIVDIGDGSVAGLLRKLNQKNTFEDPFSNVPQNTGHDELDLQYERNFPHPKPEINIIKPSTEASDILRHEPMGSNHPVEDIFHGGLEQETIDKKEPKDKAAKEDENAPVVTSALRFNEAMQTPFQLNLRNEKGNDQLRHIIIDGSNVAMIHGLHSHFSCRGIALAVQHFWDRGHREITVFVPQYRMKKHSKIKEQHFLVELNQLGLLSFTPSRTVERKRIASYDDRFMLQLAEKTDGVIVTNDYLRDMSLESEVWQAIIKDRLLQYTFAGDIFMVPDDPLGRNGPPLDQFLTKNLLPKSKSKGHSFAGRRTPNTSHSPTKPSSQTEVLNLRDRKPGGHKGREELEFPPARDTERLRQELLSIFPQQDTKVDFILHSEPNLSDLNKLSELIISLKF